MTVFYAEVAKKSDIQTQACGWVDRPDLGSAKLAFISWGKQMYSCQNKDVVVKMIDVVDAAKYGFCFNVDNLLKK